MRNTRRSSARLAALLDAGVLKYITADGRGGWPEEAPYDAIHVGACAKRGDVEGLVGQLARGGRMFVPVEEDGRGERGEQYVWLVEKDDQGRVEWKRQMGVRYVLLKDLEM